MFPSHSKWVPDTHCDAAYSCSDLQLSWMLLTEPLEPRKCMLTFGDLLSPYVKATFEKNKNKMGDWFCTNSIPPC